MMKRQWEHAQVMMLFPLPRVGGVPSSRVNMYSHGGHGEDDPYYIVAREMGASLLQPPPHLACEPGWNSTCACLTIFPSFSLLPLSMINSYVIFLDIVR
jgi:hypothetical protein